MWDPGQLQLAKGCAIGRVLVRDPLVRNHALPLQKLAQELASGTLITLGLDEHVQDLAFRVHSPPQVHLFAADPDEHLVQVPSPMRPRPSRPQPSANCRTEGEDPSPDTLIRDHDAPLGQELLDIAEADGEPEVHPDSTLDDVAWELMAGIGDGLHTSTVPRTVPTRPPCRDKAERDARGSGP